MLTIAQTMKQSCLYPLPISWITCDDVALAMSWDLAVHTHSLETLGVAMSWDLAVHTHSLETLGVTMWVQL